MAADPAIGAAIYGQSLDDTSRQPGSVNRPSIDGTQNEASIKPTALRALGIVVDQGSFVPLVQLGSELPAASRQMFRIGQADQRQLVIPVAQSNDLTGANFQILGKLYVHVPADLAPDSTVEVDIGLSVKSEIEFAARVHETGATIAVELDQTGHAATAEGSSSKARADGYRFAVYYCDHIEAGQVGSLIAYAYWPTADIHMITEEAASRIQRPKGSKLSVVVPKESGYVARDQEIVVTVDVEGLEFQSTQSHLQLWSDQQSAEFRFRCPSSSAGRELHGFVTYWLGQIMIATVPLRFIVASDDLPDEFREALAEINATPYRHVFPSYSHDDEKIVEQIELYTDAFGDTYLRDVKNLRTGQSWNPQLLRFIQRADVFQLFWSENAADSAYVRQEWIAALKERAGRKDPFFVRPVYWTDELTPHPPQDLGHLHFAKLPIT